MGMKQLMLPSKIVKKSNALARARWSPDSIWEPRLVAMLAAQIKSGDTDFQTYEIRLIDLLGKEPGGKDYKELKEAVYKAMSRVIVINDDRGWSMYNLFSKCRLDSQRGTLEICFHPDLKEHYLQLKQYMKYNIIEFMCLPSIYSQRIFEFLKSWDDQKETVIELAELHKMLNIPNSFIKDFRQFRTRVLEKAHKDILKFTDLYYTWEPIKKGRSIRLIKFIFGKKPTTTKKTIGELREIQPQGNIYHILYEKFLQKFPNPVANRFNAYKEWNKLHGIEIAPLADDVPENNELGIMEFLEQWKASYSKNKS